MERGRGGAEARDEDVGHYPEHGGERDWDQSGYWSPESVHVSMCMCLNLTSMMRSEWAGRDWSSLSNGMS